MALEAAAATAAALEVAATAAAPEVAAAALVVPVAAAAGATEVVLEGAVAAPEAATVPLEEAVEDLAPGALSPLVAVLA